MPQRNFHSILLIVVHMYNYAHRCNGFELPRARFESQTIQPIPISGMFPIPICIAPATESLIHLLICTSIWTFRDGERESEWAREERARERERDQPIGQYVCTFSYNIIICMVQWFYTSPRFGSVTFEVWLLSSACAFIVGYIKLYIWIFQTPMQNLPFSPEWKSLLFFYVIYFLVICWKCSVCRPQVAFETLTLNDTNNEIRLIFWWH